jgi:hypothetical protein
MQGFFAFLAMQTNKSGGFRAATILTHSLSLSLTPAHLACPRQRPSCMGLSVILKLLHNDGRCTATTVADGG